MLRDSTKSRKEGASKELTKMDIEASKTPTEKVCTPTKLSGCENDANKKTASSTHTKPNSNKTSLEKKTQTLKKPKEPYTFNFIPKEMVKFLDETEKEDYLNKSRAVQKDILDVFISEGIFKRGGILHISSTAKTSKGFTFAHLERPVTGKPAPRTFRRRNQAVQSAGLYVLGKEGLGIKVNKQCTLCGVRPPTKPCQSSLLSSLSYFKPTIISIQEAAEGPECTSFPAIFCSCHTPEISETE